MSNPWGKIGAWAADAERADAEERDSSAAESPAFPTLREAAAAPTTTTTKQKKKPKMSLQEFHVASSSGSRTRPELSGLTHDEMLRLPTGPKERSPDEMQYGRRGFYDSGGPPHPGRTRGMDSDSSSWANDNNSRRVSEVDQPSRADEVDNWAQGKKSTASFDSGRPNRYNSLGSSSGGGGPDGFARADEVDNWATNKKPTMPSRRPSNFGSDFRDSRVDNDRWIKGGVDDGDQPRPKLVLNPRKEEPGGRGLVDIVKTNRPSPFGAARPREEVLAEKGLDWKKVDSEIEAKKTSSPRSLQSSRPGSAQSSRSEGPALQEMDGVVNMRAKVNPLGDAKPREVLLQEKGLDWRKIDLELEHHRVDRSETEEEKKLKDDIEHLKKELEKESALNDSRGTLQGPGEGKISLRDILLHKERELELLIHELDNKVRFGHKAIERPGSGAGRVASYHERSPSQPGAYDETRGVHFVGRPRSHGTGDAWTRQGDDRRAFQGSRDR